MPLRARLSPVAAGLVMLGACTGGAGVDGVVSTTTSTTTSTTVVVSEPAGTVTLRVTGLTLPDLRSGGTNLRLVVRAATPRLTVRRQGGGGAVSACPTDGGACMDLGAGGRVELASAPAWRDRARPPTR